MPYKLLDKLVTIEFSKDPENAEIAIIGAVENNKKVVNLYKIDRRKYTPKLKVKEVSHNVKDLTELTQNGTLIGKLIFNTNESIQSLGYVLHEMYNLKIEEGE